MRNGRSEFPVADNDALLRQTMERLKRAEDALRQQETQLRQLLIRNPDGMLVVDEAGKVLLANLLACQILDRPQAALEGHELGISLSLEGPVALNLRRPDGDQRLVEMRVTEIVWNGRFAFLASLRDLTEHRQTAQALAETQRRLSVLMDNLPGIVYRCLDAPDWPMQFISDGCFTLTGYTSEELSEGGVILYGDLIHPDDRAAVRETIGAAVAAGHPFQLEYRLITRQGEEKYVWERGQCVTQTETEARWLEGFISDVTERRVASTALRQAERRAQALIENAPDGLVLVDKNDHIIFASPSALQIFGYVEDEILTVNPAAHTHPDDLEMVLAALSSTLENPALRPVVQYRFRHSNKEWLWVESTFTNLLDDESVRAIVINFRNITERKNAERTIQQRNKTLAMLHDAGQQLSQSLNARTIYERLYDWASICIPCDALFISNYDSAEELIRCVYANIEGQPIPVKELPSIPLEPEGRGFQSEVIRTGRTLLIADLHEDQNQVAAHYVVDQTGQVEEGTPETQTRAMILAPMILAGRTVGVILMMSNQKGAYDEDHPRILETLAAYAAVAQNNAFLYQQAEREITERQRVEAEILRLNAELEQRVAERTRDLEATNHELEAFSYSVSHDLRAPLRAIDGWGRALAEDFGEVLGEEGRNLLQRQHAASQRMGLLIDDLLRLSRLTRQTLSRQTVDLDKLVLQVWQELGDEQEMSPVALRIGHLDPCQADPSLLKQVFSNLLSNALKFSSRVEQSHIEVGQQVEPDGKIVYFVRDNGVGFDMRYADKLFHAFQRLHSQTEFSGTGIGLAIVQRIVHRHGGRVWAEGHENQGATFYFTLAEEAKA